MAQEVQMGKFKEKGKEPVSKAWEKLGRRAAVAGWDKNDADYVQVFTYRGFLTKMLKMKLQLALYKHIRCSGDPMTICVQMVLSCLFWLYNIPQIIHIRTYIVWAQPFLGRIQLFMMGSMWTCLKTENRMPWTEISWDAPPSPSLVGDPVSCFLFHAVQIHSYPHVQSDSQLHRHHVPPTI